MAKIIGQKSDVKINTDHICVGVNINLQPAVSITALLKVKRNHPGIALLFNKLIT